MLTSLNLDLSILNCIVILEIPWTHVPVSPICCPRYKAILPENFSSNVMPEHSRELAMDP
jgi:hypothetical protein